MYQFERIVMIIVPLNEFVGVSFIEFVIGLNFQFE